MVKAWSNFKFAVLAVKQVGHEANRALLKSHCSCEDWTESRLSLSCIGNLFVDLKPVSILRVFNCFRRKFQAKFVSSLFQRF